MPVNPFITYGYESPEYFCDREEETKQLVRLIVNENNVAMISPRRMGKTGLLHHCFSQEEISKEYIAFIIDIYATKGLSDMVYRMGKAIVDRLKPWGQGAVDKFLQIVTSLRTGISFDGNGNASWNLDVGEITSPEYTLDEIFNYLMHSEKKCIVAIDEFQTITEYPENNVEALLRTYVQNCRNAIFVFSGSQREMMNEIFISPSRPFYQSVSMMPLGVIPTDKYVDFAKHHFEANGKHLEDGVVRMVYDNFEGVTWYVQKVLNELYSLTARGETCSIDTVPSAIASIINTYSDVYDDLIGRLSQNQQHLLYAICWEGKASQITGSVFVKKYHLNSASTVQKATAALLKGQIITSHKNIYEVYDKFLALWLQRQFR